ncbi:PAS domain-containing protein [Pyxidicoccus fallax]|uniref:histidine kinase n=1 Tax=Pyxidicoccus fallax TaxID=394095 RepID=A0A848LB56_9BACT|nr:PAS domain-containing protein [Pyxidicoccus fallax]NMO16139.1 PAS domain-containing protein [Pyxidicoccus fallax]NPC83198.1 PAS domain-containing protein [Pyxidicoccus fallax]
MRPLDLADVFRLSPNPYMVLDRQLRYVTANDAYLRATASRLEDIQGRGVFDLFPHDPNDPNNESVQMLRGSLERVLSTRAPDVLALIPYRVPMHTEQGVVVTERFWSATHTPLLDEQGEVAYILQHTVDVTELQQLKQAAEDQRRESVAASAMEAGVLGRAMKLQETNRLLDTERRHLLRLFEQAPSFMAFLRGREHVFELANPAYEKLVGRRDVVGRPVREALPEVVAQGFVELLDRVYTSGEPYVGRGMLLQLQRHADAPAEEVALDFIYQPILGVDGKVSGIFVQGHDITVQKRVEAALKESEERFRNMADHAPVMLWVTDPSGACTYLNRSWYEFTGQTEETGLGFGWLSATHPDDMKRAQDIFLEANAKKAAFQLDYRLLRKDGEYRWAIDSAAPRFSPSGEFLGYIGSVVDLTERKRVEEEMRRFNAQLERRVQERTAALLEANNELESFSYSVSHDLRAPLRHIMGFANLLEARAGASLDATGRRHLKTISDAARQGGKLVDDLLEFSRMGRTEMKKSTVSLGELVAEAQRDLAPEAEGRKVQWRVGALPTVRADSALLRLVLKNLLSNALKYSRTREEAVIEVWAQEGDGEVEVLVRDNGVGFEMQYVDKLFGVFQRLHRAEQFEGTGIGLANVRRIIARHGGRTWAEGAVGQGATFHFTLPREEPARSLSA